MYGRIIKLDVQNQELLRKCARLYCEIWKEPPWNEYFWKTEEVMMNIQQDMSRLNANGFLALEGKREVLGFTWGYEVLKRDLLEISGVNDLDFLFQSGKRIFYIDELGVHSVFRRLGIGERLSHYLIFTAKNNDEIRSFVLRTDIKAVAAKRLYKKLGFNDLNIKDSEHHQRTYWLLEIP